MDNYTKAAIAFIGGFIVLSILTALNNGAEFIGLFIGPAIGFTAIAAIIIFKKDE